MRHARTSWLALFPLTLGALAALHAGAAPAAPSTPSETLAPIDRKLLEVPFEKYTLPNGLEVILHRDPSLPLVAVNTWYHVGPANEPPKRSGFAHLFEHLMFEGSRHVGHRFDLLMESVGATNVNGTTNWDRTNYYQTVPPEHLELVLWIESDRMGWLLDSVDQERLDLQREVVKNERRQHYDNSPYGPSELALYDILFPVGHPYHGAVIGSMEDLSAASLDDVRAFFRDFYAPSNATVAIAGDIDLDKTKALVEKYYGSLPTKEKPPHPKRVTPPLAKPVRVVVEETVDLPKVTFGFIVPPAYGPKEAPLTIAGAVLAGGKATRLYQSLVVEKKIASEVSATLDTNDLAGTLFVDALAARGHTPEELETALSAEIQRLATDGPTQVELARAKRRSLLPLVGSLQLLNGDGGESGRAGLLQHFNHRLGDPGYLPKYVASLENVTADDVRRAVAEELRPEARAVVVTRPKAAAPKGGAP